MTTVEKYNKQSKEDVIRIQDLFHLFIRHWYWFAVSIAAALLVAVFYICSTPPEYERSAVLLLKETSNGKSATSNLDAFSQLGFIQENTNINNEIIALQSPVLMEESIRRLGLTTSYKTSGKLYRPTLYGSNLPVRVLFLDLDENESASFMLQFKPDGHFDAVDFERNGVKAKAVCSARLGDTLESPLGRLCVVPTIYYSGESLSTIYVSQVSLQAMVRAYSKALTVNMKGEKSTIVELCLKNVSPQRAEDLLYTLISVYNENWVKDKNQLVVSTSLFIDDRLGMLEKELGTVDDDISTYKSRNLVPDVRAAYGVQLSRVEMTEDHLLSLNNRLSMTRFVRQYLLDENRRDQLLPANAGLDGAELSAMINDYNTQLLQRNNLIRNGGGSNPLVKDLDMALEAMRRTIIETLDNTIESLNMQIANLEQVRQESDRQIAANPVQAKELLSYERQQKVKEALYLFLLQKREENELSQAFSAYNSRIITPPGGSVYPVAPAKGKILAVAFVLGLLLPGVILFLKETMNTKVRGRQDMEGLSVPLLGEIPLTETQKRHWWKKLRDEDPGEVKIVVKENTRDVVNESFRIVRTNMELLHEEGSTGRVWMTVSFLPNSGKTFVTMNLGLSLAVKGRKVLLIDLDMRKGTLSRWIDSPAHGISDCLAGRAEHEESMIVKDVYTSGLDVLPAGTLPPNPTELLAGERFAHLINRLKTQYDYILMDCPPIGILADTALVGKVTDRTLFVVRAGYLHRDMLQEMESLYREKKYPNMAVVLNSVRLEQSRYGSYHYGYGYGYGYGYTYTSKN